MIHIWGEMHMGDLPESHRRNRADRIREDRVTPTTAVHLGRIAGAGLIVLVAGAVLIGFVVHRSGRLEAADFDWSVRHYALEGDLVLLAIELTIIPAVGVIMVRNRRLQQERLHRHAEQVRDNERRRMVGELHDGVVQDLAGINYALERLRLGGVSADQHGAVIADSAARLRHSIGALRTLMSDRYPPNLAEDGLRAALAGLADRLKRAGMNVRLDVLQAERLPPVTSALIFRAAEEAVRNVEVHSDAQAVVIQARREGRQVTLIVEDDGRGFDSAQLRERRSAGHVGLRTIRDLVSACGGALRVRAAPGRGTTVQVEVPVE